jgi:peptide/nickel transport system substrate-binding protein
VDAPVSRVRVAVLLAAMSMLVAACGGGGSDNSGNTTTASEGGAQKKGGTLTVLADTGYNGAWPAGLDPATNTNGAANQSYMTSIFGQLFELRENGKIVPTLASGYTQSTDGMTFDIKLRPGMTFSDGSPFDADTVAWHFNRVLKSTCTCRPNWPTLKSVSAQGADTVEIKFSAPNAAFINQLIVSNANWVASKKSLDAMGERAFRIKPVGAGPFKVVSNKLSSELVLERNPDYYNKDRPFLDKLIFKAIGGGDEAALQALQSGQAQAYENMSTPTLVDQASKNDKFTVLQTTGTSPYNIQLNMMIPPFNNKKARDAIYYATDSEAIRSKLFNNRYPNTQSFTGEGGLFFTPTVPGYKTYDLAKAKQLVQELGGLNVDLGTIKVLVAGQVIQALQSQWQQAGIKVQIHNYDLAQLIQAFQGGKWQSMLQTAGSYDPAAGVGVAFRYSSMSPFTGVKDKKLDGMIAQAAGELDKEKRGQDYADMAKYMSDNSISPFLFSFAPANLSVKGVKGPGLTSKLPAIVVTPTIPWEEVSYNPGT